MQDDDVDEVGLEVALEADVVDDEVAHRLDIDDEVEALVTDETDDIIIDEVDDADYIDIDDEVDELDGIQIELEMIDDEDE